MPRWTALAALIDDAAGVGDLSAGLNEVLFAAKDLVMDMELAMRRANSPKSEDMQRAYNSIPGLRSRTRRLNINAGKTYRGLGKVFKAFDAEGRAKLKP